MDNLPFKYLIDEELETGMFVCKLHLVEALGLQEGGKGIPANVF